MRLIPTSGFISKYRFELVIILVELVACAIVALTLLKLLAPAAGLVLAAEPQPTRRRPFKLATLVPLSTPIEPVEIQIVITEHLTSPMTVEPTPVDLFESRWPGSTVPANTETSLTLWPVQGEISQGFGCSPYFSGRRGQTCPAAQPWFHDGLDIVAELGTPVQAGLAGTVIFAGPDGAGPLCGSYQGYGLGVVVDNGQDWQALYAHLAEIKVVTGQQVTSDTVIGLVGDTGCVTGTHLHFGLRHQGALVDPRLHLTE